MRVTLEIILELLNSSDSFSQSYISLDRADSFGDRVEIEGNGATLATVKCEQIAECPVFANSLEPAKFYVSMERSTLGRSGFSVNLDGMLVMFHFTSLPFHLLIQYAFPHSVKHN